jgi:hypothetical protein
MTKERFVGWLGLAVGIAVLSVLAAQIGVDVYMKKHPTNFQNLAWGSPAVKLEETRMFGDYAASIRYDQADGRLKGIRIEVPEPDARACDYFFYSMVRRFDPPAAAGGDALDFFQRAAGAEPPKSGRFWASWFTAESAVRLECRIGSELSVSFSPLQGMDVRGQRQF